MGTSRQSPVPWGPTEPFLTEQVQLHHTDTGLMLSGGSGFCQTRRAELILALKRLPLMSVAFLPYREIHLRYERRLWLFIKNHEAITSASGAAVVTV